MRTISLFSIVCFLSYTTYAQQKISGTITYRFNQYQGDRADIGATVFITDSAASLINYKTLDSAILADYEYSSWKEIKALEATHNSMVDATYPRKKREENYYKISERDKRDSANWNIGTPIADSLDARGLAELRKFQLAEYITKADGVGNYSLNIRKPGTYYVLLQSANHRGHRLVSAAGELHLFRVQLKEGDEKNISARMWLD